MNLTALIEDRLAQHFTDIGAKPVVVSAEDWPFHDPDPADSRRMLGVTVPRPVPGIGWEAPFCPEILAKAAQGCTVDMLDHLLTAVEFVLDKEVELLVTEKMLDTAQRIEAADNALAAMAEGSLGLLSDAQFRILDAR